MSDKARPKVVPIKQAKDKAKAEQYRKSLNAVMNRAKKIDW